MPDVRIALAALAVVAALASVETVRGGNVPRQRHLQRRSPKPPLKLKPFKLGKLLGLLENAQEQGDELLAPPTLLQNLIGEDGDEVTMPLDKLKDKLGGVGGGQLLDPISMFIPPIGQVIALAVLSFILFILVETVYFTQVDTAGDLLGGLPGTNAATDAAASGASSGLLGGLGGGGGGGGGGLLGGLLGGGGDGNKRYDDLHYQNSARGNGYGYHYLRKRSVSDSRTPDMTPVELHSLVNSM